MKIAQEIIDLIRKSKDYKNRLAVDFNIDPSTLRRWLKENHVLLTTAENLEILSRVLGVPKSKLLVKS